MKISELVDIRVVEAEVVDPLYVLKSEYDDLENDLATSLEHLATMTKLLGFLSDKRLVGKLTKKMRADFAEVNKEVIEFLSQWSGGG